jgi:hypothetical protein
LSGRYVLYSTNIKQFRFKKSWFFTPNFLPCKIPWPVFMLWQYHTQLSISSCWCWLHQINKNNIPMYVVNYRGIEALSLRKGSRKSFKWPYYHHVSRSNLRDFPPISTCFCSVRLWLKISTYLQSGPFLSITFILINLKLLILFVLTPNVLCYVVLSYRLLVTSLHLCLFACLFTFYINILFPPVINDCTKYIYTYNIHTYIHRDRQTDTDTDTHTHTHTYIHTYTHIIWYNANSL